MSHANVKDPEYEICTKVAGYCNDRPYEDENSEYVLEEDESRESEQEEDDKHMEL